MTAPLPRLWCPLLTHYTPDGALDFDRMRAHLEHLRPHVPAYLIPGSTGDGWQLSDPDTDRLVAFARDAAAEGGLTLLVGALRPTLDGILDVVRRTDPDGIAGFTVCAPHGDLTQSEIEAALDTVLALGHPTALYQLPQITGNRIAPDTVARLAARHPNCFLFKDTSGEDTVALSGLVPDSVFLVRGAEGDYARWLAPDGPYDGFLLSTANSFPAELRAIVDDPVGARGLSERVSACVADAFAAVADVPVGNAFANANKAIDHVQAWGDRALAVSPPVLHGGARLPAEAIRRVAESLTRHGLHPDRGYRQ